MKRGSVMPWVFSVALLICVCIAAVSALASDIRFSVGERLNHVLSVCIEKQDAIDILTAHSKEGFDKASELWDANPKCSTLPVRGAVVGKVVFTITVKKDGEDKQAKIVEILDNENKVMAYFITSLPVENKRDRDA